MCLCAKVNQFGTKTPHLSARHTLTSTGSYIISLLQTPKIPALWSWTELISDQLWPATNPQIHDKIHNREPKCTNNQRTQLGPRETETATIPGYSWEMLACQIKLRMEPRWTPQARIGFSIHNIWWHVVLNFKLPTFQTNIWISFLIIHIIKLLLNFVLHSLISGHKQSWFKKSLLCQSTGQRFHQLC